jgi:hypothetical protein
MTKPKAKKSGYMAKVPPAIGIELAKAFEIV